LSHKDVLLLKLALAGLSSRSAEHVLTNATIAGIAAI